MKKTAVMLLVIGLLLSGCSQVQGTTETQGNVTEVFEKKLAVTYPAGTAAQADCILCGDGRLWHYHQKFDSIGVLDLATGDITDLRIFEYEDDGTLRNNSGYSSSIINTDDAGRTVHTMTMGDRGICNLKLSWPKDTAIQYDEIAPQYCADCMEKITAMDAGWDEDVENYCPFAMIDFTTGELYSLNGILTSCFIRDYYMNFDFDTEKIDGVVVYAPPRTFE